MNYEHDTDHHHRLRSRHHPCHQARNNFFCVSQTSFLLVSISTHECRLPSPTLHSHHGVVLVTPTTTLSLFHFFRESVIDRDPMRWWCFKIPISEFGREEVKENSGKRFGKKYFLCVWLIVVFLFASPSLTQLGLGLLWLFPFRTHVLFEWWLFSLLTIWWILIW